MCDVCQRHTGGEAECRVQLLPGFTYSIMATSSRCSLRRLDARAMTPPAGNHRVEPTWVKCENAQGRRRKRRRQDETVKAGGVVSTTWAALGGIGFLYVQYSRCSSWRSWWCMRFRVFLFPISNHCCYTKKFVACRCLRGPPLVRYFRRSRSAATPVAFTRTLSLSRRARGAWLHISVASTTSSLS